MVPTQMEKRGPFAIERKAGKAPGTVIFHFSGTFTARDMYTALPPASLEGMLAFLSTPGEEPPALNILDLTDVPYMDSSGLATIVRQYVRCKGRGIAFIAAGASPRVVELLKLTRLDGVIPMAATLEEADIQ
jgi:anti-anti-sigma factor